MKKIEQYISGKPVALLTEHILKGHLKKQVRYYPNDKNELIQAIKTELDKGNTNLNCIDTSKITEMDSLFDQEDGIELTEKQQKTLDVSNWDISNVTSTVFLFFKCQFFNGDISKWNLKNVKSARSMFSRCSSFNCDLSNWRLPKVESTVNMFNSCLHFNQNLEDWNLPNTVKMVRMFQNSPIAINPPSWGINIL